MTKEEYYNLLASCVADGKLPAIDKFGNCCYRIDGKACPAGLVLPEKNYKKSLESKRAITISHVFVLPEGMTIEQLQNIQNIHDAISGPHWDGTVFLKEVKAVLYDKN